jgi:cytochrome b561
MFSKFGSASWKRFQKTAQRFSTSSAETMEAYPGMMQAMHWAMGGALVASVGCVQGAMNTKDKALKGDLMFYHKSFGVLTLGLLIPRVAVRLMSKVPEHLPGAAWEVFSAKVTHALLYVFMIVMPISGTVMGYYSGKGLPFFWKTLPGAEKADGAKAKQAFQVHKQVGSYLQYVIPLHAGAVGYHFLVKGRNILPRILPFGKP